MNLQFDNCVIEYAKLDSDKFNELSNETAQYLINSTEIINKHSEENANGKIIFNVTNNITTDLISNCVENIKIQYNVNGLLDLSRFTKLIYLDCSSRFISELNYIPETLETLICNHNYIQKLNNLPEGLKVLMCSSNNIKKFDKLPNQLKKLDCSKNLITELDNLPNQLEYLDCSVNLIKSLDNFPTSLRELYCTCNQIEFIKNLPSELEVLCCGRNKLKTISINSDNFYDLVYDGIDIDLKIKSTKQVRVRTTFYDRKIENDINYFYL